MTREEFIELRHQVREISQLEEVIQEYQALQRELGLNLNEQIESMIDELDELKRGFRQCYSIAKAL